MRLVWFAVSTLAACSFTPPAGALGDGAAGDDVSPTGDGAQVRDIPHVPAMAETPTEGDLTLGNAKIDTEQLVITGGLPDGVLFAHVLQDPGGTSIAVLRARTFVVDASSLVQVVGAKPLVVVAETIRIRGTLSGAAIGTTPGPGGGALAMGPGAGASGTHAGTFHDAGGGGGGFATAGARGGSAGISGGCPDPEATGAAAGAARGDAELTILEGGAGGGNGSNGDCLMVSIGGAGGGALQLSATESLEVEGTIHVGGGGGGGGVFCNSNDAGAGSGGGAGGAIYLDAPALDLEGAVLAANGGGGGGGGCGPGGPGVPGQDAKPMAALALGGGPGGGCGTRGGDGATTAAPTQGIDNGCDGNGGGGGGAAGRIVIRGAVTGTPSSSPAATSLAF